jgi:hypothetical protein
MAQRLEVEVLRGSPVFCDAGDHYRPGTASRNQVVVCHD